MGPEKQLERTRGHILGDGEQLRVASRVLLISGGEARGLRARGRLMLALTDQRLLVVNRPLMASRATVVVQWPADDVRIAVTRRRLGASLIHVTPIRSNGTNDGELVFEWLDGHQAQEWANYLFR